MKKFSIYNVHSPKENKQRLFDFFVTENGEPYLEVKIKKSFECIAWKDVLAQIRQGLKKSN